MNDSLNIISTDITPLRNLASSSDNIISSRLIESFRAHVLSSMRGSIIKYQGNNYQLMYDEKLKLYGTWHIKKSFNDFPIIKFYNQQSHVIDIDKLPYNIFGKDASILDLIQSFEFFPENVTKKPKVKKEMLIILTTCNQLKMTIFALEYLKSSHEDADFLVVDDHSVDGTVDYLVKKGYAIVTKNEPRGLTDSWNVGYEIANSMGYKHIIFTNNDVLVTSLSVKILNKELRTKALVVPLTSPRGAGHNPVQSIVTAYRLNPAMSDYVYNFRFVDEIQLALARRSKTNLTSLTMKTDMNDTMDGFDQFEEDMLSQTVASKSGGKFRFNGFLFGVNLALIKRAAYKYPQYLFDPHNIMVGQEDSLMAKMRKYHIYPVIAKNVYIFHFKSVTIANSIKDGISSITTSNSTDGKIVAAALASRREKRTIGSSYMVKGANGKKIDIREQLALYHPEMSSTTSSSNNNNVIPDIITSSTDIFQAIDNRAFTKRKRIPTKAKSSRLLLEEMDELSSHIPQKSLIPPISFQSKSAHLTYPSLYFAYKNIMSDTELQLYPSHRTSYHKIGSGPSMEISLENDDLPSAPDDVREVYFKSRKIIALATSDPLTNPAAGDIFTAYELGDSLQSRYNVEIRYLRKGISWYSIRHLYDVDVLITLLDDYDLSIALTIHRESIKNLNRCSRTGVKSSLFTIAWMRNWFHRWQTRPWIGNYDLILTSSSTAKQYFDIIGNTIGLQVDCFMGCPQVSLPPMIYQTYTKKDPIMKEMFIKVAYHRLAPPVEVYPIATNPYRFYQIDNPNHFAIKEDIISTNIHADYVFTGSYFNKYRNIMDFDPGVIRKWKGLIVGEGWDRANVTEAWRKIAIGRLPYEMIPRIYRSVKIVIDDANHVTAPWGSVNSRVFDALASGALVISNGKLGINHIFSKELMYPDIAPVFRTGSELAHLIDFYMNNPNERTRVMMKMQQIVLNNHTYGKRAIQIKDYLQKYDIKLTESLPIRYRVIATQKKKKKGKKSSSRKSRKHRTNSETRLLLDNETMNENEIINENEDNNVYDNSIDDTIYDNIDSNDTILNNNNYNNNFTKDNNNDNNNKNNMDDNEEMSIAKLLSVSNNNNYNNISYFSHKNKNISLLVDELFTQINTTSSFSSNNDSIYITGEDNIIIKSDNLSNSTSLCIGIRTIEAQAPWLQILTWSLIAQYTSSIYHNFINFRIYIINTESTTPSFHNILTSLAENINHDNNQRLVFIVNDHKAPQRLHKNPFYGYDSTDILTSFMLQEYQQAVYHEAILNQQQSKNKYYSKSYYTNSYNHHQKPPCEWILLTNGDNLYNSAWFDTIASQLLNNNIDIIGFDFVTHHSRSRTRNKSSKNNNPNQPIRAQFRRGYIDLGSFIARARLYLSSNAQFLSDSIFTRDLFARDYFTIMKIISKAKADAIKIIHRCLLFHQ
eukprot:gene10841-14552_t